MKLTNKEIADLLSEDFDDFNEEEFDESRLDPVEPLPVIKFEWEDDESPTIWTSSGNYREISETAAYLWSDTIDKLYWKAMSRHETYHGNVAGHIWFPSTVVYHDNDGFIVGQFAGDVFVASHFAPRSLRSGASMLKRLASSKHPIVLCPKQWMEDQLKRIGWMCIGHIPQFFNGMFEIKSVMINDGANRTSVMNQFKEYAGMLM